MRITGQDQLRSGCERHRCCRTKLFRRSRVFAHYQTVATAYRETWSSTSCHSLTRTSRLLYTACPSQSGWLPVPSRTGKVMVLALLMRPCSMKAVLWESRYSRSCYDRSSSVLRTYCVQFVLPRRNSADLLPDLPQRRHRKYRQYQTTACRERPAANTGASFSRR